MWPKEYFTPFGILLSLKDSFGSRKETPLQEITSPLLEKPRQDPTTIFRTEVVNICGDGGFRNIHDPGTMWPNGLHPELSFSTEIASEKLPEEVRDALGLQGSLGVLKICFGLRSETDPERGTDRIFLFLAKEGAKRALVLSAQLNEGLEWDMATSVYTPGGEPNFPSFQTSVFAETAKLARICAENELSSSQAV